MNTLILLSHFLFVNFVWLTPANAKIEKPNYDFSMDKLVQFDLGKTQEEVEKILGKGETIDENSKATIIKYHIAHIRYKFPILIRFNNKKIVDYHARLPSYFIHDVFHQSIINRFGKQDTYALDNGTALYTWTKKENVGYLYSSTCTLTCFPIYFSAFSKKPPYPGYKPLFVELTQEKDFKAKSK
ncbi:MAG: hypothetical protein ACPGJV_08250 [Bacteriovoracaceae bacterium]